MKNITTIGRILFAIPFAIFRINHFLMTDYYLGMLTSFIPLGTYTIIALLKDISLMGGSLMIAGIYYENENPDKS
jgi:uncharacterized membrane protein